MWYRDFAVGVADSSAASCSPVVASELTLGATAYERRGRAIGHADPAAKQSNYEPSHLISRGVVVRPAAAQEP